jgi:mutator protein MutT
MLQVTAAIINDKGKVLICQRGAGGNCAFLWEFPGGKLEPGESKEECLARECAEELGVKIVVGNMFAETTYQYPDQAIAFTFFNAEIVSGEITPRVHRQVRWVAPNELPQYDFCPADVEVVQLLVQKGL